LNDLVLDNITLNQNKALDNGGGLYIQTDNSNSFSISVSNSIFSDNSA
jgi:predicted outer membrane repeat protein